jgi:hypothetical protein
VELVAASRAEVIRIAGRCDAFGSELPLVRPLRSRQRGSQTMRGRLGRRRSKPLSMSAPVGHRTVASNVNGRLRAAEKEVTPETAIVDDASHEAPLESDLRPGTSQE